MRVSRTGRQAQRQGTVPGGIQAPCAKHGRPPAGKEHRKYPGQAKGDVADAKWLAPKLFARGLCSSANVSCHFALEGNGCVWRPCGGTESGVLQRGCRGPGGALLSGALGFSVVIPDSLLALPGIRLRLRPGWWGPRARLICRCPKGVPGHGSTGRAEGWLSSPRITFQPPCQAGATGTADGTGGEAAFKRERLHHAGLGGLWEAETSSVKHIPTAPSPRRGTFNPLFDGRPRKYFFHILNLLAPVNHLNLLPLRTHTPMSFPSLAAVKDAATLFAPAFSGRRTAINY